MTAPVKPSAVVRGRQQKGPHMHWRLDGAGGATDPLVLCLHGYGMDEDFFAVLLQKLFTLPMRFLIPRAPQSADMGLEVENGGSWYEYDGNQERFREELLRVEAELLDLIRDVEAAASLAPRSRFLLGFSQGGYCGSWTALRHPEVFSGLVVSGARIKTEFLGDEMTGASTHGFRALICHGRADRSIAPDAAARSRDAPDPMWTSSSRRLMGHSLGRRGSRQSPDGWLGRREQLKPGRRPALRAPAAPPACWPRTPRGGCS
jgi:predicted esterase